MLVYAQASLAGEQSPRPHRQLPPVPSSPQRSSRPLPKIPRPIACKKCHTCITSVKVHLPPSSVSIFIPSRCRAHHLLGQYPPDSQGFRGFLGKASLFTETYNVKFSRPSVQLMVTGAHTMQEITCSQCSTYLGWKIIRAHEHPERWKEGLCLLELECLHTLDGDSRLASSRDGPSSDTDSDSSFVVVTRTDESARPTAYGSREPSQYASISSSPTYFEAATTLNIPPFTMFPDIPETSENKQAPSPMSPTTLDALRSPPLSAASISLQSRESVSDAEFKYVALDDENTFSPVTLTSHRNSQIPITENESSSGSTPQDESRFSAFSVHAGHKKTASTITIRSSRGQPFFVDGPELQGTFMKSNRGSIDGQQKLQEEFARIHKETTSAADSDSAIDWDFWGAVISDYQGFAAERPNELAKAIARGIPATLRGMMWQHMAASKDPELESTYLKLLKETSLHEKAITRDLGRTFPHHDFFTNGSGIGQENLFNVLKAYSLYDPQVGYCQGLPFVVAILLLNMPDEEAFSLLVRLMYVYDIRGHFLPEMPRLQLRLFQFDRLIEELLPVLHVHFLRQGIKSSMFCSQWFLTMFSYRFPLETVFRIYDNCLANGIEAIFGFSVVLLKKNEEALLALKFDEILAFLNNKLLDVYKIQAGEETEIAYDADQFVRDSVSLQITPFMLDSYRHEYEDIVRENNKHAVELDELRNSNRALSTQVKNLETSLAQLNTEHVQVLNELVKQRLCSEEMEQELVRYKLL
ncbi:hypothetical protein AX15_002819 [Amanita polypyramis BW_CC]|nr:hypothetical protein AX15_002819 [Amanita polypyramis BW_CC]